MAKKQDSVVKAKTMPDVLFFPQQTSKLLASKPHKCAAPQTCQNLIGMILFHETSNRTCKVNKTTIKF